MRERTVAATWGKTRIEALSDGVFAIAVTLLVLDIRVPDLPTHPPNAAAWHAVLSVVPTFISFVITFVIATSFWYAHHVTFHSLRWVTRSLMFQNAAFLLFVSLLPFSAGLLGKWGPNHPVALTVYFVNLLALGLTLNLIWWRATAHRLVEEPLPDPAMRFMIGMYPVACAAALAVVPFQANASYYAFVAVALVGRRFARRRYKRAGNAPAPL